MHHHSSLYYEPGIGSGAFDELFPGKLCRFRKKDTTGTGHLRGIEFDPFGPYFYDCTGHKYCYVVQVDQHTYESVLLSTELPACIRNCLYGTSTITGRKL
jgi:hypothetical protein